MMDASVCAAGGECAAAAGAGRRLPGAAGPGGRAPQEAGPGTYLGPFPANAGARIRHSVTACVELRVAARHLFGAPVQVAPSGSSQ